MNLIMLTIEAHPASGKEVTGMDDIDVDVAVCGVSITFASLSCAIQSKDPVGTWCRQGNHQKG